MYKFEWLDVGNQSLRIDTKKDMCLTRVYKRFEYVLQYANHFVFNNQHDWRDLYDQRERRERNFGLRRRPT